MTSELFTSSRTITSRIAFTPNVPCGPSACGNLARKSLPESPMRAFACCTVTPGFSRPMAWK